MLVRLARYTARTCAAAGRVRRTGQAAFAALGLRAAGVEAACGMAVLALYPLGLLPQRGRAGELRDALRTDDELSWPIQRALWGSEPDTAGAPVLLLHGVLGNRSIFTMLAGPLRRQCTGAVHALNYSPLTALTGDVRGAANRLAEHVEQFRKRTGQQRVHIVGHSLGGLIARYYVQRLGGSGVVDTLVTLGSPHHGTQVAQLAPPTPLVRQLRPGSDLLTELAGPAPHCRTRFVTIWSRQDQLIIPQHSARLEHPDLRVEAIELRDVGHLSLMVSPCATRAVVQALAPARGAGTPDPASPDVDIAAPRTTTGRLRAS